MPHKAEPLTDKRRKPYYAYLAELRSIGGLSGSPVFVFIDARNRIIGSHAADSNGNSAA